MINLGVLNHPPNVTLIIVMALKEVKDAFSEILIINHPGDGIANLLTVLDITSLLSEDLELTIMIIPLNDASINLSSSVEAF